MKETKVIIVGGGAAGFFAAITCARYNYNAEIIILEKSNKLLSKVKISGGGRCNVTHACFDNVQLCKYYPRGGKELKTCFAYFSTNQTVDWFESRGVRLKTEPDGRMFPITDNSQTVVDCLIREARVLGVKIMPNFQVSSIRPSNGKWIVTIKSGEYMECDKVLVATGGNYGESAYQWLKDLNIKIVPPVPSLFSFNVPNSRLSGLQGISVADASVRIEGTRYKEQGPILITHWGFSGPAIIRLSSWAARDIFEMNYDFNIHINWLKDMSEEKLRQEINLIKAEHPKKNIASNPCFKLPQRLWERLAFISGIEEDTRWCDLPLKACNRFVEELIRGVYNVKGKNTYKEEFVTAGGVCLSEINLLTMESLSHKGLYFAGEVLNIDALTGGFNFQAAWTTGFLSGKAMGTSE
ncbi:MAG: NAD(P)/FAD-dependent oxidoreductase [Cytophagaceae bacterium]|nr:NAD(P)/FAD-dependent oxidoreductase [Cytophagaceae bacterium]MDW8456216.1 NAD(P)/FAD-dependent oxidoreductase [Cytophagaceae bacterium]